MELVQDVANRRDEVEASIGKYGYFAEHNYSHFFYNETDWNKNVFFDFGSHKFLLAQFDKEGNVWSLFPNGILAPEAERMDILSEAVDFVLNKQKAKKFQVEVSEPLRKEILKRFKMENSFRACNSTYILYWPMYNMDLWDPQLEGGDFKKLRNIRNTFYKRNEVTIEDSRKIPEDELFRILDAWLRRRSDNDRVDKDYFTNLIDNGFKGFDIAKTMCVNGKPATITAGWKIPNSNDYYSSIGIQDYSFFGLGEVANIEDLNRLKQENFDYVDFGGSDKDLLTFKKKFKPEKIYKTYLFSIVRA